MPLSEDVIQRAAPDAASLQNGRDLVRKKAFSQLGVSADGTWLLGRCKGSGKEPYSVSVDLANESAPVGRCNCPSRKFPCKHALGLMVAYLANPGQFAAAEPSEELLAKRGKQVQPRARRRPPRPRRPRRARSTRRPRPRRPRRSATASICWKSCSSTSSPAGSGSRSRDWTGSIGRRSRWPTPTCPAP